MYENIYSVVNDNLCTGCGTCVALCPKKAIDIALDKKKGIYVPKIDKDYCINCSVCLKVCPGYEIDYKTLGYQLFEIDSEDILGVHKKCYIGYALNTSIRFYSSSGGLVSTLLIYLLEAGIIDGALVVKMNNENPFKPEPFVARTKEAIITAIGSKYCPVPMNVALKEILEVDGRYAFVGLPCHINGLRKAQIINKKLKERVVICIGILCAKNVTLLGTEFCLIKNKINPSDVSRLDYRGSGWPGYAKVELKDHRTILMPFPDFYFFMNSFTPHRCAMCSDASCELADIAFGDAWLPEIKMNDKVGTSVIISRTNIGDNILKKAETHNDIRIKTISHDDFCKSQGNFSWKKREINARMRILKITGHKFPIFNNKVVGNTSIKYYIKGIISLFEMTIASKRSSWWMLSTYYSLLHFGSKLKKRI